MTLEELKSLRKGEVVVFVKVDEKITEYHNYVVGDELKFYEIRGIEGQVDFFRSSQKNDQTDWVVSHFSYEICDYIERRIKLERNKRIKELGL